jgi:hypothetical protein
MRGVKDFSTEPVHQVRETVNIYRCKTQINHPMTRVWGAPPFSVGPELTGMCGTRGCLCLSSDLPLILYAIPKPITRTGCWEHPHYMLCVHNREIITHHPHMYVHVSRTEVYVLIGPHIANGAEKSKPHTGPNVGSSWPGCTFNMGL